MKRQITDSISENLTDSDLESTEVLFLEICNELSLMVGKSGLFDFMLISIGLIGSEDNTLLVIIKLSSSSRLSLLVGETSKIKLLQN